MSNILKKLFHINDEQCEHRYPDTSDVAYFIDREDNLNELYFCNVCEKYMFREINNEKRVDPGFFSEIKKRGFSTS